MSQVRNVQVENTSTCAILVRVSYQKSAITSQHFQNFSKLMTSNVEKIEKGGGFGIGIPGYANFNLNANKNTSEEHCKSGINYNSSQIQTIVSPFLEDGWVSIKPNKSKRFGVQGQISWISVIEGKGNLVVPGWNTTGDCFIYDGDDFEEQMKSSNIAQTNDIKNSDVNNETAIQIVFETEDKTNVNQSVENDKNIICTDDSDDDCVYTPVISVSFPQQIMCESEENKCVGLTHRIFGGFFIFLWDIVMAMFFLLLASLCTCGRIDKIFDKYFKLCKCSLYPEKMKYCRVNSGKCCGSGCDDVSMQCIYWICIAPLTASAALCRIACTFGLVITSLGMLFPVFAIHLTLAKLWCRPWCYKIKEI